MKSLLAGRLLLRRRSSLCSLVQVPTLKNEAGSPSAVQCTTFPGWMDGAASLPPDVRCPSHRSERWVSRLSGIADDAAKGEPHRCWSCEHETLSANGLFCPSCGSIQPLDPSVDFFQIFSIVRSFNVDLKLLEQKYKDLQKTLHPDLAHSKSQREQGYSAEQSAHVIQAYYVLLRPLSRARYLLELDGIKVDEEGTIEDTELLMEIMEVRELIEDASDAQALKQAQAENNERIRDCQKALESDFRKRNLTRAISSVQRLAYYMKASEEIIRKL